MRTRVHGGTTAVGGGGRLGRMLGLPPGIRGLLFDLDGVLTQTARVHAEAWKQMFDAFLEARAKQAGELYLPFDAIADYDAYVDGKQRADGARSFLESRRIQLPEGSADDGPEQETINGLGTRKNIIVLGLIRERGVEAYAGSVRYVKAVRAAGLVTAVVSSSANCRDVLVAAGIDDLFDARVDGVTAARDQLAGKPAPATFLAGAAALGVGVGEAAVFEDALAGVAAGRAGGFAFVVGVDRTDQADALLRHGADVVVTDLDELLDVSPQ